MMGLGLLGWLLSDGYQGFWGQIWRIPLLCWDQRRLRNGFGLAMWRKEGARLYPLDLFSSTFVYHYTGMGMLNTVTWNEVK
jgi:hypothetical protein